MITSAVAFLLAFVVSVLLTPLVRDFAIARQWTRGASSSRDVHDRPIPRLGGVAIVVGFFAPLLSLFFVQSEVGRIFRLEAQNVLALLGGGCAIAVLGVYDDIRGSSAAKKFAVQIAVACGVWFLGVRIDAVSWFGGTLSVHWISLPLTVIWIVGIINALNLIDGLDGLASGIALLAIIPSLVVAGAANNVVMLLLMAALAGAILGFLIYNFNPASVFMGDTGSMFLGFILATASIIANTKSSAAVSMLTPILALGLPIMDTFFAMLRRSLSGTPLFSADRGHFHHRLLRSGLSHRRAVLTMYAGSCVLAGFALAAAFANGKQQAILLVSLLLIGAVLIRRMGVVSPKLTQLRRRRNLQIRARSREIRRDLSAAVSVAEAWELLTQIRPMLACQVFSLETETEVHEWAAKHTLHGPVTEIRVPLVYGSETLGHVRAVWRDGRTEVDRDDEVALELLAGSVAHALYRVLARNATVISIKNHH